MIRLEIEDASGKRREWSSDQRTVIVGRAEVCDLTLDSDLASRRHIQLHFDGNVVRLSDLGSANGTFVNGHRVHAPVALRVGDEIGIGQGGPRLRVVATDGGAASVQPGATRLEPAISDFTAGRVAAGSHVAEKRAADNHPRPSLPKNAAIVAAMVVPLMLIVAAGIWFAMSRQGSDSTVSDSSASQSAGSGSSGQSETSQNVAPGRVARESPDASEPTAGSPAPGVTANDSHSGAAAQPTNFSEKAIVWVGWQAEGFRVPICTAWAVQPDRVVLTAQMANYLDQQRRSDPRIELFVYDTSREQTIELQRLVTHPRFEPDAPGSQMSLHHNVGLGTLASPLSASLTLLPKNAGLAALRKGQPIRIAGYAITREMQEKPFDPLNPPSLVTLEGTIASGDLADSNIKFPRRVLGVPFTAGLVGSPVIAPDGSVLAIVQQANNKTYGIVAPVIEELLNQ